MILIDTHVIVWWTIKEAYLSATAKELLEQESSSNEGILISAASFWELAVKEKQSKLNIGISVRELYSRLRSIKCIQFVDTDPDIWIEAGLLDWSHKDPIDRLLVVTAQSRKLPFLSEDPEIKKFYEKTIW